MCRKGKAWSDHEVAVICNAYVVLYDAQVAGDKVNKAALCRETLPKLDNRTRGSYEAKMMNISAALRDLGKSDFIIKGYKPSGNYQKCLQAGIKAAFGNDLS